MDRKLIVQIYALYKKELYIYIYSLCKSRELSEDILQETFLKALLCLPAKHSNIRAWLYTVARNLYLNHIRGEKKKTDLEEIRNLPADNSDVAQQIIEKEESRILLEALQNLSQVKREVLVLQYFSRLSQKEIAAILHLSPENVRILSFRGKRELKKYLEAKGYDI